jgi:hypothetical protein
VKSSVLKDVNFINSGDVLNLAASKPILCEALERDLSFLRAHFFMDYSLLVAVEDNPNKNYFRFPRKENGTPTLISQLPEDG